MEFEIYLSKEALMATKKLFNSLSEDDLTRRGFSIEEIDALHELYSESTERLDEADLA